MKIISSLLLIVVSANIVFSQNIEPNQILRDFINWKVDQITDSNCQNYKYIQVDKELINWQSQQEFVNNYLRDLDSSEVNQLIMKHKPSKRKYKKLKNMLHSDDYASFADQLEIKELVWMPNLKNKIKCSKGSKSSATFRFSKPLISRDQNLILITEELANNEILCWNRKIIAYVKKEGVWIEFLTFNQQSICE